MTSQHVIETVIYGSAFDANVRLDRKPDPAAVIYLLDSWVIDTEKFLKRKECDIAVYFCRRFNLDAKGEEIKAVMDTVENVVDIFVEEVLADSSMVVTNVKAQSSYGKFDCNTCGYTVTFHAADKQGQCITK